MRTKTLADSFAEGDGNVRRLGTGAFMEIVGLPFKGVTSDLAGWCWEREAWNIAELAETLGTSVQHARTLHHGHQLKRAASGVDALGPPMLA